MSMTWSLNASGHLQNKESEEGLIEALRGVLSKYGTQSSLFGGTFVGRIEGLHAHAHTPVAATIAGPKSAVVSEPEPVKAATAKGATK